MVRKLGYMMIGLAVLVLTIAVVFNYYSYIFARTVSGKVLGVERVTDPAAIVTAPGGSLSPAQIYSFAVAVQTTAGEIVTGSTEDRQWAIVKEGQCAEAKFFPYPPWDLNKAGTYHDVRLVRLFNCP